MDRHSVATERHRRSDLGRLTRLRFALVARARRLAEGGHRVVGRMRRVPLLSGLVALVAAVTPLGWGVGVVAASGLVVGLRTNWTELVAVGISSAVVLALSLLWSLGRSGHHVALTLERPRVTVGERALGELVVSNPSSRALPAVLVELPVGAGTAAFATGRLAAGEEHAEPFGIATTRRGVVQVGPATAVRGDSLGLVRRTQTWSEPTELFIHPRTVPVNASAIGFIRDVEGATTQDLSSADVSFHALRDYVAGDDRRNIHWKTTARTGRLMVRQFEETRRAHLLLVLDLDRDAWMDDEEFETGVSAAASLALATMRDSKEVSIITQLGALTTPTPMRAMDSLSGVDRLLGAERLPELARKAGSEVPQASVAVLVTGSGTSLASLHAALAQLPLNTVCTAARIEEGRPLDLHTVGGFPVATVPALEDFALAMRKALG